MIRLLIYIALVLILGFGFAWLADRPGSLSITWQGQLIEMSLMVAVSGIVGLIAIIMIGWWLIRTIVASPHLMSRYFRARKRDRGYQALSTGLIAAGAGDAATARKMTQRTMGLLSADQEPLIHLLDAQTDLIEGKNDSARAKFEAMVEDPETRELGLRGLYLEARRLGAMEAAQHYAEEAAEKAPHLPWAAEAALGFRSASGDWDDAIRLLEKQRVARVLAKVEADRKKAVLLTARAMQRLDGGEVAGARTDGVEANKLAPDLVPAALIAAQALYRENSLRKGSRILEKMWKSEPHPDVADAYIRARPGDSTHDRLKRAQKLEGFKRNHVEALYAVARAALDAQEFSLAREKAEAAVRVRASEGVFLLLADIEEAETGDQGRVRHWLAQAVRAPRDPAWTADGYVADHWAPVSPVTGKLDAFEWKVPVEQIAGPVEDADARHTNAEQALKSLPPLAASAPVVEEPVAPEPVIEIEPEPVPEDPPAEPEVAAEPEIEPAQEPAPEPKPEEPVKPDVSEAEVIEEPAVEKQDIVAETPPRVQETEPLANGKDAEPVAEPAATEVPVKPDVIETVEKEPAVEKAASEGETHIVTDAVGADKDKAREAAFLAKPPDDPGVKEGAEPEEPKSRFRLF
ncbi:heme biosynthesis protein HemY [Hoeflea prorocentri]|uniref:Heme biosynthesis protein HemY n=1 Tax=Hoeflea prorocentri TaxID=1922333 RepID=A0A9X3ZIV5_9HYPH|nr:heme biosynthesis protein HemY [Hoeflea prorocentri]MCY6383307.1 heme biosynthesis protein HemY [Hoeflea prorocentri]MDA5401107.1 heme biosynthesis protein HemY [Hoeflea prorocentri]